MNPLPREVCKSNCQDKKLGTMSKPGSYKHGVQKAHPAVPELENEGENTMRGHPLKA